jgi:hypothetical protein
MRQFPYEDRPDANDVLPIPPTPGGPPRGPQWQMPLVGTPPSGPPRPSSPPPVRPPVRARPPIASSTLENSPAFTTLLAANPVGASILALNNQYYQSVLEQAQRSFLSALGAAIVGLLFFVAAIAFLLSGQAQAIAYVSLICGILLEVLAALGFYAYGHVSQQLTAIHQTLDTTERFMLANNVCETLGATKEEVRAKLTFALAGVPVKIANARSKRMSERRTLSLPGNNDSFKPVPRLEKLDLVEATERADKLGMRVVVLAEQASEGEPGRVIEQTPPPNTLMYVDPTNPQERPEIRILVSKKAEPLVPRTPQKDEWDEVDWLPPPFPPAPDDNLMAGG